ncbi:MAG: hypothetical protein FWB99_02290 [Treponema sp.]|nr:hypothetical protein [Treponema sp.]
MSDFLDRVQDMVRDEVVGLVDNTSDGNLRADFQSITGLDPNRYYYVEVLNGDVSLGYWFVTSHGILAPSFSDGPGVPAPVNLDLIGRVSQITNLNNDFTYVVRNSLPLTNYTLTFYDIPSFPPGLATGTPIPTPPDGIFLPAPNERYFLNLVPALDPAGNYAMARAPVTPAGNSAPIAPASPAQPGMLAIELHGAAPAETTVDYLFIEHENARIVSFRTLRVRIGALPPAVQPPLTVTLQVIVLPDDLSPDATGLFTLSQAELAAEPASRIRTVNLVLDPLIYVPSIRIITADHLGNEVVLFTGAEAVPAFDLDFWNGAPAALFGSIGEHTIYIHAEEPDGTPWLGRITVTMGP